MVWIDPTVPPLSPMELSVADRLRLRDMAERVLATNRKTTRQKGQTITYTCPAVGWYDHQWLWDSCFHAITLSHIDPVTAKAELSSLLASMRPDGFLPGVILRDRSRPIVNFFFTLFLFENGISRLTQPPVEAAALEQVYDTTHDTAFLKQVLPKVMQCYDYLPKQRDPEGSGLLSVVHPWETGIDSSPAFDSLLSIKQPTVNAFQAYRSFYTLILRYQLLGWDINKILRKRYFNVKHVMFNCIYAQGLWALSRLCTAVDKTEEAQQYEQCARKIERAIIQQCWNGRDGLFYDVSDGKQLPVPTISSLFPLLLETIPPTMTDTLVYQHLLNSDEFWTPYPLATVARNHPTFRPTGSQVVLWRGPVWINANWFLINGLHKHGYNKIASELLEKTAQLLLQHTAFYEFYNPLNGAGQGQKNFSWSSLIVDLID